MSEFRGRGRGRGGFMRGGPRRGGYTEDREGGRGGFSRGRGEGFSRGRGGPPRHLSRDDSPPRKVPMMSRGYDSERGRGPPMDRRVDRYSDGYERAAVPRSRDLYSSPPRDSSRMIGRLSPPPRSSLRDREHGLNSRGSGDYLSSRGEYMAPRSYTPPRESASYRDSYGSGLREGRGSRGGGPREYPSSRGAGDYLGERSREFRDGPREYGSSREFREPLGAKGDFRDREYSGGRFMSRQEGGIPGRGPPSREYGGRGGPRGSLRGGRDERGGRGSFLNGSRGRGAPRGRGRPDFRGERRSPPPSREGPLGKRPRMDGEESYSRR